MESKGGKGDSRGAGAGQEEPTVLEGRTASSQGYSLLLAVCCN